MSAPIGRITEESGIYELVVERSYPAPLERVWQALVDPKQVEQWLGTVDLDLRKGGHYSIDFDGEDQCGGSILTWDPPHTLEYEWSEGTSPSVVRFDLTETSAGMQLRLTHSRQTARSASGTGAGWHAHLDLFEAALEGREAKWETAYAAARPLYEGSVPASARAEG